MDCTGTYRSVNELTASSSIRSWLRRLFRNDKALLVNVSPVVVTVKSDRLTWVWARVAIRPLTNSCRLSNPPLTLARQMFCAESASVQPVTRCPPEMMGREPGAACQDTVKPLVPESADVNVSGELSAYVPPASWTTMSPVIVGASARTLACAWESEHGWADEQAVPDPLGDAKTVAITAALAERESVAMPVAAMTAVNAATASTRRG
jgi:hypothetical protein